jgi:26S proteasome regulatory subunit N2
MANISRWALRIILSFLLKTVDQAIGIALESRRFDIISQIYESTGNVSLLSYAIQAVLDTGFSLSYRDQVLSSLYPLFPPPAKNTKSPHILSVTRLLVTLSSSSLTVPLLTSLIPQEKLLAYQLAFDLVECGAQDFLESIRSDLPEGDEVSALEKYLRSPSI